MFPPALPTFLWPNFLEGMGTEDWCDRLGNIIRFYART